MFFLEQNWRTRGQNMFCPERDWRGEEGGGTNKIKGERKKKCLFIF
jgi:hypothetical protein